ncbi:hypothetical protein EMA8858_01673 [Emticicia aquatica]|uniref:DUF5655 domain-containing protein n=1 Tax=Emticicia aquatica TaxID=1681835 RepID=A0ABM9ANZ5_9BACT|nr:DUF5655 domain-containing protein [Emticicia aquatica]CAH0995550.1 hypothetical protein EMA8858_01673 [Emticicia aquatica]
MSLFSIKDNECLEQVKELDFKLEKDIQKLTENNLKAIFNLKFVKNEFVIGNFRIDTLAFDFESNAFVIIEYKRDKNYSVIDQGFAYLSLMLNNKADFILEFNENNTVSLKRDNVDWSQSKVIFVSPYFTTYQREAISFKDLPIELWEVKRFDNKMVSYTKIQTLNSTVSVKTISRKDDTIQKVSNEIKVYTEQEHLAKVNVEIFELYQKLKTEILNLDEIEVKPKKLYIAFVSKSNIIDINFAKNNLKLWINLKKGELNDPKGITRDVSNLGHWGNGDYEILMNNDDDFDYIISLIKQSLKKNKI